MFQLEAGHPGKELGLALALLRARVAADVRLEKGEDWSWLKIISPICLKMIEDSLNRRSAAAPGSEPCCCLGAAP